MQGHWIPEPPELLVGHPAVVARATLGALAPGVEGPFGVGPLDQRGAVPVAEVHPAGVVEEDVEVGPGLAGGLDGLQREVDGPVDVGESAGLLAPERGGEDDVGELGGLGQEGVLDDEEEVRLAQDLADPRQVGHRDGRVGRDDPEEADRAGLGVSEDLHGVGRRGPVRDRVGLDVPEPGELPMCSRLSQFRKPGISPSQPHSRLFSAVGWPFIWRTPQPGLPIIPRISCRLLTWTAAAVAWFDW